MDFRRLIERAREHATTRPKSVGQQLATGQQPTVLFITCADSRIVTSAITGAEPGSVFELRTAGNVIPEYRLEAPSSEMATIEFAVVQLGVSEVIVCGHSHCGAVSALHGADIGHLPAMRRWLSRHARTGASAADPALREEGKQHVLEQLRKLETYPFVRYRAMTGDLRVHGWFYDIETAEVLTSATASFQPL
ncbi:MAG: carbonic anhydrase [Pseudonocardiales bacterium]|jgi:carbonic anhydrase|uniref:Carbonic anhydrase n=1 Tax=Lentzea kristufekii TaxID=3095430 RepID=A0ABU4U511_9PSEU|nr:carbonic anhydrase [Lentzea sp. BCCO 10_0798]MDT7785730.1 carbonic anhydrase [Pseudonocardiales bacterium]MDX8055670.1 carbonic anhydrase [Lentzea sp. BCCO 10_0798]